MVLVKKELGGSVPHGDDLLGHQSLGCLSGKSEIADFENSLVGVEQIGCFEVSVDDLAVMEVGHGRKEVLH